MRKSSLDVLCGIRSVRISLLPWLAVPSRRVPHSVLRGSDFVEEVDAAPLTPLGVFKLSENAVRGATTSIDAIRIIVSHETGEP